MAFSTLRRFSGSHAMNPTVQASKGAAGAPGAAAIPAGARGSAANDAAALGGMGAVGAGLLGKFAYDKYKQAQTDAANAGNEFYEASDGTDFSANGPNADVMGGLGTNSGGVVFEPGQQGMAAFGAPGEFDNPGTSGNFDFAASGTSPDGSDTFNMFGSQRLGDAALGAISPAIKALGFDDNLANLQGKLGFDPVTGIIGRMF